MVKKKVPLAPERGDIVWISLDPARGHEQAGRRPAIVLSKRAFNKATGLALMVPITSRHKGYTNEVPIMTQTITGAVLSAHLRAVDWNARGIECIGQCPHETLREIREVCATYIAGE